MDTMAKIRLYGHEATLTPEGWECPDKATAAFLNIRREKITHLAYLPDPARDISMDAVKYFGADPVEIPEPEPFDPDVIY